MSYLDAHELLTGLNAALQLYDRQKGRTGQLDQSRIPIREFERLNQPIDIQVSAAGATKGILGKPRIGQRVVTGGYITLNTGASRFYQIFVVPDGGTGVPISSASTRAKNLVGELHLTITDTLAVVVAAAANETQLFGHLSYYDTEL